jgi:hypothetical protein
MSHQVDSACGILVPEVDHEHEEGAVNIVEVGFLACFGVAHDQADARRWSDGPSILSLATCLSAVPERWGSCAGGLSYLVAKSAHSGSHGLLLDAQPA